MENTFQHTPGPWAISPKKTGEFMILADDPNMPGMPWHIAVVCADVTRDLQTDDAPANARLIAAAPELLEALQVALKEIAAWRSGHNTKAGLKNANLAKVGCCYGGLSQAKSAIQKATTPNT